MGVIDLNARLTALEKKVADDPTGTVIDQLEAAVTDLEETVNGDGETDLGLVGDVTDLEETVNGDGETDLGLVGDVAALQSELGGLITDVTSLITVTEGITASSATLKAYKIGNLVFLTAVVDVSAGSEASGTEYAILDIDSSITPESSVASFCSGQASAAARAVASSVSSKILVNGGNFARFIIFWTVAAPAPAEETPAEE